MTASATDRTACPDDLELAAYVDKKLPPIASRTVESHIAECGRCAAVLIETSATLTGARKRSPAFLPNRAVVVGLAAAAVLVLAVVTYRSFSDRVAGDTPQQAFARFLNAYSGSRMIEPRVTGQPIYAAYTLTRGSSAATDTTPNADARRAGLAVEQAARGHADADSLALVGKTQLLLGDVDQAIQTFEKAGVDGRPDRLTDLAAAYIARGSRTDNKEDLRRGLEFADRAVAAGAGTEARFNRALAREKLGQTSAAVEAWREYLSVESNGQWRREAEEHLQRLGSFRVSERLGNRRPPNGNHLSC